MRIMRKIKYFFCFVVGKLIFVREYFQSLFDKSIRIRFTNFSDIPHDFFLEPLHYSFKKYNKSYRIVKQYKPNIEFFSVFGKKNQLLNSK
jgi:hypothetical protein